jgi:hypothetical protein
MERWRWSAALLAASALQSRRRWSTTARRLRRDEVRRARADEGGGRRPREVRHPRQLGASRLHRHADDCAPCRRTRAASRWDGRVVQRRSRSSSSSSRATTRRSRPAPSSSSTAARASATRAEARSARFSARRACPRKRPDGARDGSAQGRDRRRRLRRALRRTGARPRTRRRGRAGRPDESSSVPSRSCTRWRAASSRRGRSRRRSGTSCATTGHVDLIVSDSRPGIDPARAASLFRPSSTPRAPGGWASASGSATGSRPPRAPTCG